MLDINGTEVFEGTLKGSPFPLCKTVTLLPGSPLKRATEIALKTDQEVDKKL